MGASQIVSADFIVNRQSGIVATRGFDDEGARRYAPSKTVLSIPATCREKPGFHHRWSGFLRLGVARVLLERGLRIGLIEAGANLL